MQLLSHYTSQRSLIGIVRSQSLWATDFLALNDKMEFTYAMSAIYEEALTQTVPRIPSDLRDQTKGQEYIRALIPNYTNSLRKQIEDSDGFGSLYVTSFARGKNEDEDERGIPTLWDRYTRNEGYCVQFEMERIRQLLNHECNQHSYAWIELADVTYGIDREKYEFKQLVEQLSLRMLQHLFCQTRDHRLETDPRKINTDSSFLQRLLSYCGKHKDPAFADEREMRIFACPVNVSVPRVFTGIAAPKTIYRRENMTDGARYIVLGDTVIPGPIPNRIVIGPKAELPGWMLDALYPQPPSIKKSTIPIR